MVALLEIPLHNQEVDYPIWRWEASNSFSVRSTYRHLSHGGCNLAHANIIQKGQCPLKVEMHLSLITKDTILTQRNLQKRGVLYQLTGECINHLFLSCEFMCRVWLSSASFFGLSFDLFAVDNVQVQTMGSSSANFIC